MEQGSTRDFYRIHYPARARPALQLADGGGEFEVLDLSEQGLQYAPIGTLPTVGTSIRGAVALACGGRAVVEGSVVRVGGRQVAVQLDRGVPLRLILDEQRFLHERYGRWT